MLEGKVVTYGLRAGDKEAHGRCRCRDHLAQRHRRRRHGQRRDIEHVLATDAEGRPAGGQESQPGTGEQHIQYGRHGLDHLLNIVEEQQQVLRPEDRDQPLAQGCPTDLQHTDRLCDRGEDESGVTDRGQRDVDDAVLKHAREIGCNLEGEAASCRRRRAQSASAARHRRGAAFPARPPARAPVQ